MFTFERKQIESLFTGYRESTVDSFTMVAQQDSQVLRFQGNIDSWTERKIAFPYTFIARFIRLNPIEWVNRAALKWELFGCGMYSPQQKSCNTCIALSLKSVAELLLTNLVFWRIFRDKICKYLQIDIYVVITYLDVIHYVDRCFKMTGMYYLQNRIHLFKTYIFDSVTDWTPNMAIIDACKRWAIRQGGRWDVR